MRLNSFHSPNMGLTCRDVFLISTQPTLTGGFFIPNPPTQNNHAKQATVNTLHYFVVAN